MREKNYSYLTVCSEYRLRDKAATLYNLPSPKMIGVS